MVESTAAAFIGAVELALPSFSGPQGLCQQLEPLVGSGTGSGEPWWQSVLDSGCRTGQEFRSAWEALRREGRQCSEFLGKEIGSVLAIGPGVTDTLEPGLSSRKLITDQREELREAVLSKALRIHPDRTARPGHCVPSV